MMQHLLCLFVAGLGLAMVGFVMYLAHVWYEEKHSGGWDE